MQVSRVLVLEYICAICNRVKKSMTFWIRLPISLGFYAQVGRGVELWRWKSNHLYAHMHAHACSEKSQSEHDFDVRASSNKKFSISGFHLPQLLLISQSDWLICRCRQESRQRCSRKCVTQCFFKLSL